MTSLDSVNFILTLIIVSLLTVVAFFGAFLFFSKKNKNTKKESKKAAPIINAEKEDIMKFLPFDTIEDDMIIQNNGEKFTAMVECKGINYYLMSEAEKISVEEVFIQFLNSIKYPIQIYIQTRTVSLDDSIALYKERLSTLETSLNDKINQFREADKKGADENTLYSISLDIEKKENMVEYTRDLINNISLMTNNHNVLQKKYYIAISYYISEAGLVRNFSREEMKNLAYTELSTKAHSILNALSPAGIECHMLSSEELAEVMYIALNRDDSDILSFEKAMSSQFFGLYSTAKDPSIKRKELKSTL